MATMTGTLLDFGIDSLDDFQPTITFIPSGPATDSPTIFATKPISVVPDPDGSFEVVLKSTDELVPEAWYTITIEWLDSTGGFIGKDFPDWKLTVPYAGGDIAENLDVLVPPYMAWFGPDAPLNPSEYAVWVDTDNGNVYKWIG